VANDDEEAVKWYRQAAEQGHSDARNILLSRSLEWVRKNAS